MDEEELSALLGYAEASWGGSMPGIVEKGERVFGQQSEVFGKILKKEVADLAGCGLGGGLTLSAAMHRLSHSLAGRERAARWRIGASHLHTTANRLGLSNPEEVYAGCLLRASARHFLVPGSALHRDLREALASRRGLPPPDGDLALPPVELEDPLP
jgi:hypothetical protein